MPTTAAKQVRGSLEPFIKDEVDYYAHQVEGIRLLSERRSWLLADDMGLGKTLQALTVFGIDVFQSEHAVLTDGTPDYKTRQKACRTAIIVCPTKLKDNWADEFKKYTRIPFMILDGSPKKRKEQLIEFASLPSPKALITNYEQIAPHLKELNAMRFDVAIFDEAHYMKNGKAARTQAALGLYSRRSFLLTGTPMLNRVNELWTLLHRIAPSEFPNYHRFVARYCVLGGYKDKEIVGTKNEPELLDKLGAYMLRRLKSEVLDLPELQFLQRRVRLTPQQQKLYDEAENELQLTTVHDPDPMEIQNGLTKALRLKQICGTTLPFTGEDHSSKLDLALEDDQELLENGHKIIQFSQFRSVMEAYTNRAEALKIPVYQIHGDIKSSASEVAKVWGDDPRPGVLLCNTIMAVGFNATQSRHVSFLDKLFVPGLNQQAIDRAYRIGASATQPVQVREYICIGTYENRIETILGTKSRNIAATITSDNNQWKKELYQAMRRS